MKHLMIILIFLTVIGCTQQQFEAKDELSKRPSIQSGLGQYDLTLGVRFKDLSALNKRIAIKDSLASETCKWLVAFLEKRRHFKSVVNLDANPAASVDVVLRCTIRSLTLEDPGISTTSKTLGIFYGVAPVVEHYGIEKEVSSSATVNFQLIDPTSRDILWDKTIIERVKSYVTLNESTKVVFDSVIGAVQTLLMETKLSIKLSEAGNRRQFALRNSTTGPAPDSVSALPQANAWALVMGVSKYKDPRIPALDFAEADAIAFHDWLVSPGGGNFSPGRVRLLTGSEVTAQKMKNALFVWMRNTITEDLVVIYFAGHGSPESPDFPSNLFLLPYDAQYENIAGTGFPMWDIETALKRFVMAKKVVVIADACHAGGVGEAFDIKRRDARKLMINPIGNGMRALAQVGDGICVISASDVQQYSQEGKDWGGGHGVFTHYLIEGLAGNADRNLDKHVTLGELIPYVSERVRRATKNAQSPTVAGKFDPALCIGQ
jgi:uncharacterized caspase-like protein